MMAVAFARVLSGVRRASAAVWLALVTLLLALVYVSLVPLLSVARRLSADPRDGWRARDDAELTTLPRLRSLH